MLPHDLLSQAGFPGHLPKCNFEAWCCGGRWCYCASALHRDRRGLRPQKETDPSEHYRSFGTLFPLHGGKKHIEWASARVPPTPLLGGWAEGGWSISNPVTSQILAWNLVPFDSAGSNLSVPWTLQPLQPCQLIVLRRRIGLSLIFPIQW